MSTLADGRILVTGGAGLIGSHIIDELVRSGATDIVVLDNLSRGRRDNLSGALASGRQTVILRKGGILEASGFQVEAPEFFLFPTAFHQAAEKVREAAQAQEPGRITHLARVAEWRRVESLQALHRLRPFHIYSDATVEERFRRWGDGVHALVVRVYRLAAAVDVPDAARYAGCKSWFDLSFGVDPRGAEPVMSDSAMEKIRATIIEAT